MPLAKCGITDSLLHTTPNDIKEGHLNVKSIKRSGGFGYECNISAS
jgi:hypothetical protein